MPLDQSHSLPIHTMQGRKNKATPGLFCLMGFHERSSSEAQAGMPLPARASLQGAQSFRREDELVPEGAYSFLLRSPSRLPNRHKTPTCHSEVPSSVTQTPPIHISFYTQCSKFWSFSLTEEVPKRRNEGLFMILKTDALEVRLFAVSLEDPCNCIKRTTEQKPNYISPLIYLHQISLNKHSNGNHKQST